MPRDTRKAFLEQLDAIRPGMAQAFLEAIADLTSVSQIRALEAAIDRGDLEGAFQALRLGREFFAPLDQQITDAFQKGATWGLATSIPKRQQQAGLIVRFDARNPRAERWVREAAGNLITEIVDQQRTAVRGAVQAGIEAGQGPRKTALDIVGRMDGNRRKGGILGLHSRQADAVAKARAELSSFDGMRDYLRRGRRDQRFDKSVARAIRDGKALTPAQIERISGRYADRLLSLRGETIARTESLRAFSAGRMEGTQQMIDSGQVPASAVKLVWRATPSGRTRDTHAEMNDQEVNWGQPFVSPSGAMMMHPGDTSLGAPGEETIQCRCSVVSRIDFVSLAV